MTTANERQVGGTHYNKTYQHWDFVCDTGMHYLIAQATRYLSRWRDKNGLEDLEKALHYVDKAEERAPQKLPFDMKHFWCFVIYNEMEILDGAAIYHVMKHEWDDARTMIKALIEKANAS